MIGGHEIGGAQIGGGGGIVIVEIPAATITFSTPLLPRVLITPQGVAARSYRLRIEIPGASPEFSDTAVPVNWQARYAYDRSNYLFVTLFDMDSDLLEAITDAIEASLTVNLYLQSGYRFSDGSSYYADLIHSIIENADTRSGPRSSSTLLSGYLDDSANIAPKAVTLGSANTIRTGSIARGWTGPMDDNVAPGDQVTISDTGDTWVVGNISYRVDARSAIMEISELTDADLLAGLPW